jgi:pimeloyl-ACP methyl ester carboxylesterase
VTAEALETSPPRRPDRSAAWFDANGVQLYFERLRTEGSELVGLELDRLVLLHPNRTNRHVWDLVVDDLRRMCPRLDVLMIDLRGHGDSQYPQNRSDYALDKYVTDLAGFIMHTGRPEKCVVVGAATGGTIAAMVSGLLPRPPAGLVLLDPASFEQAVGSLPFADLWRDDYRRHFAATSLSVDPEGSMQWRYHPEGAAFTESQLEDVGVDDLVIQSPALVARGNLSPVLTRARLATIANELPDVFTAEIPCASHRVMQDQPAYVAHLIVGFLTHLAWMR